MKLLKWVNNSFDSGVLIKGAVVGVVGFSWSWLFSSRVSQLADSVVIGYLLALLAFVVIVGLSSFVFIKTIMMFRKYFLNTSQVSAWVLPLLFVVWAAVEYLVAWASAAVWIGHNGSIDSVLPFASFTPFVAHTPLRYLSRIVGFHGLSAVVVVLVYVCAVKKLRRYALATCVVVLVVTIAAWGFYRQPSGTPLSTVVVAEKLYEQSGTIVGNHDLVVFPEYGLQDSANLADKIMRTEPGNTAFVGSKQVPAAKGHKNVLVFGTSSQGVIEQRAKSRLIPGGEYLPYIAQALLTGLRADHTMLYFQTLNSVEKGEINYRPLQVDSQVALGSAVCASIIAPDDYRHFAANGATVFTNSASLGIFASKLFTFQHQGLATFMATANARPFLQSSNDSEAFAVDHNGQMLTKVEPINTQEILVVTNSRKTLYTMLGEWPVYVGLVVLAVAAAKRVHEARRAKSKIRNKS